MEALARRATRRWLPAGCRAGPRRLVGAGRRATDPRGLALRELPADTGEPPADCAAWIHDSERPAARLVTLHALAGRPVLTIGWTHAFCRDGGMFCLEQGAGRTRFEVNLDAVERGRLRVHPQVLRLARARSRG
ncbi:YfiR family protein [Piscinibacter sakaiensis]|uniref:YfiR family protein n=1 Tax=Piscinibacter sakaiensis TaxID=1547922 RepID=UPI00372B2517